MKVTSQKLGANKEVRHPAACPRDPGVRSFSGSRDQVAGRRCLSVSSRNDISRVFEMLHVKRLSISILIFLCILALTGCVPVIIAAVGATAGGAIIYDKRSSAIILQDQDISNQAIARLNADPVLKGSARVTVATFNHVVLILGQAESDELRQTAYEDVKRVKGIKRIYNQIEVISPILTTWDQSGDAWITSKVKAAMLAKPGLSSSQIKVVTENKVVYLMGLVSPSQARIATDVARTVSGVRKVVQVFEYES